MCTPPWKELRNECIMGYSRPQNLGKRLSVSLFRSGLRHLIGVADNDQSVNQINCTRYLNLLGLSWGDACQDSPAKRKASACQEIRSCKSANDGAAHRTCTCGPPSASPERTLEPKLCNCGMIEPFCVQVDPKHHGRLKSRRGVRGMPTTDLAAPSTRRESLHFVPDLDLTANRLPARR